MAVCCDVTGTPHTSHTNLNYGLMEKHARKLQSATQKQNSVVQSSAVPRCDYVLYLHTEIKSSKGLNG